MHKERHEIAIGPKKCHDFVKRARATAWLKNLLDRIKRAERNLFASSRQLSAQSIGRLFESTVSIEIVRIDATLKNIKFCEKIKLQLQMIHFEKLEQDAILLRRTTFAALSMFDACRCDTKRKYVRESFRQSPIAQHCKSISNV